MSITFVEQDLTTSDADYICHQVNCCGKMNSGVAKAIREKWPVVFNTYFDTYLSTPDLLGTILSVKIPKEQTVINMFAQLNYGYDDKRYTSYDAFWSCLGHIRESVPKGSKIAFPYKIGSDRGGANWEVIYTMIVAVLGYDYNVEICYLQEDGWLKFHLGLEWE